MTDFLVQRLDGSGLWADEGIARGLKADEAELAVTQVASGQPRHLDSLRRVTKWEHVEEFTTTPGPPTLAKATKAEKVKR